MKALLAVRPVLVCLVTFACVTVLGIACTNQPVPVRFDGSALGYCAGSQVEEIKADECVGAGCSGSAAYALCNGTSYTECTCQIPNGYSLDGGEVDGGSSPPPQGIISFGGGGPSGVALPCCFGNEVFEIPASECGSCGSEGPVAYAVCQGGSYSACSCDIPAGYDYPDGSGPCGPTGPAED